MDYSITSKEGVRRLFIAPGALQSIDNRSLYDVPVFQEDMNDLVIIKA